MTEFWAAVIGAIVGSLAGGGVTWFLQERQDKRRKLEQDQGLARSLFYKLMKIHSDLEGYRGHVAASVQFAQQNNLPNGWQSLRPIGNGPKNIEFSPNEMSYLLSLGNFDLFNTVHSLDVVHSSTIDIFELYATRRMALTDKLPAEMNGLVGTTQFDAQQFPQFAPRSAELNKLVADIVGRVEQDAEESKQAMLDYNGAIKVTLGHSMVLTFDEQAQGY